VAVFLFGTLAVNACCATFPPLSLPLHAFPGTVGCFSLLTIWSRFETFCSPAPFERPSDVTRQAASETHRAIILVVERDPHVRELEAFFLNEAGFGVEFAADGEAALAMAREMKPDIIITEVLVPKLDGLALCRAVRKETELKNTVVLIFSILAAQGRAREAGADAFLMKPLAEQRLVQTVRELLAQRAIVNATAAHP
jgi:CheY-like chemotaxis protein